MFSFPADGKKVAIYVCGGLGNQLFQFACLLAYCEKYQYTPVFDRKYHGELHTKDLFWEQFSPIKNLIQEGNVVHPWVYQEDDSVFQEIPSIPHQYQCGLLRGYFNNEKYFVGCEQNCSPDDCSQVFVQKCLAESSRSKIIELFRSCFTIPSVRNCVGIHVRRGDYLKYQHVFNILGKKYYERALQSLDLDGVEKCIVSEDVDWCKANFSECEIRRGTILEDFCVLISCTHLIIANSTFSWWAAYLNPYVQKVKYPMEWFSGHLKHTFKYHVTSYNITPNAKTRYDAASNTTPNAEIRQEIDSNIQLNIDAASTPNTESIQEINTTHTINEKNNNTASNTNANTNKYIEKEVWEMITSRECGEVFGLLKEYSQSERWELCDAILNHLDFPYATENDIFEGKFYNFVLNKNSATYQQLIEFSHTYNKPLTREMRQMVNKYNPSEVQLKIDMLTIPLYVITGEERKPHMLARFQTKGLNPIIISSVPCKEKCEGCCKAHINALKHALRKNIFPCIIFEDDVTPTADYKETFFIPKCDAVYIGLSRYGMGDWNQMGIRGFIRNSVDVHCNHEGNHPSNHQSVGIQYYQIYNMLSAHAIIYVNKEYVEKMISAIEMCLTLKFINDVATARLQEQHYVVAVEKPFFVQDVLYAKNQSQRQNNLETYVSMTEFSHT